MTRLLILLCLLLPFQLVAQKSLQFIGEKIDFEVNNNIFSVNGVYYFLNQTDDLLIQTITFPFSKESDSIIVKHVFDLNRLQMLEYKKNAHSIHFKIRSLPNDTLKINIAYSQKTEEENIYILKSTQSWGRALKHAKYALKVDESVVIKKLSLKPDTLIGNIYYWEKEAFYPTEDLKVWIN